MEPPRGDPGPALETDAMAGHLDAPAGPPAPPAVEAVATAGEGLATDRLTEPPTVAAPSDGPTSDWLDRICPYLLSEDGTYRSSQPDASHRCMAQDPPGLLPMAFQERFCLTERHVRCEMYKVAQSGRAAALGGGGPPEEQVRASRFRPSVRSVPLALGPSSDAGAATDASSRRPVLLAAVAIAVIAIVVFMLVLVFGGAGSGGGTASSPSPSVAVTVEPTSAPPATAVPAATASALETSPAASSDPLAGLRMAEYVVQEGEALLAIGERFGVTRRQILLANPGMAEAKPYTEPGQVIIVPVSPEVSEMLLAASPPPGFEGFAGFLD
jgi:hypothetical protein